MKIFFLLPAILAAAVIPAGCATKRMSSEDLEVLTRFRSEINILHSNLPPNSEAKYKAAKTLVDNVDFSYTRNVSTLDNIFSSIDARVDNPRSTSQQLNFYYQYGDKSIRFVFHRKYDYVVDYEIIGDDVPEQDRVPIKTRMEGEQRMPGERILAEPIR